MKRNNFNFYVVFGICFPRYFPFHDAKEFIRDVFIIDPATENGAIKF